MHKNHAHKINGVLIANCNEDGATACYMCGNFPRIDGFGQRTGKFKNVREMFLYVVCTGCTHKIIIIVTEIYDMETLEQKAIQYWNSSFHPSLKTIRRKFRLKNTSKINQHKESYNEISSSYKHK